jgi:hypothetical protein
MDRDIELQWEKYSGTGECQAACLSWTQLKVRTKGKDSRQLIKGSRGFAGEASSSDVKDCSWFTVCRHDFFFFFYGSFAL